jgi:hypothetical protein
MIQLVFTLIFQKQRLPLKQVLLKSSLVSKQILS